MLSKINAEMLALKCNESSVKYSRWESWGETHLKHLNFTHQSSMKARNTSKHWTYYASIFRTFDAWVGAEAGLRNRVGRTLPSMCVNNTYYYYFFIFIFCQNKSVLKTIPSSVSILKNPLTKQRKKHRSRLVRNGNQLTLAEFCYIFSLREQTIAYNRWDVSLKEQTS